MAEANFENWITKNLTEFSSSNITKLATGIFAYQHQLVTVNIPNVTGLSEGCFYYCDNLENLTTGSLVRLESDCLCGCSSIAYLDVSQVTYVGTNAFNGNSSLTSLDFASLEVLADGALWSLSVDKVWIPSTCIINGRNFYTYNQNLKIFTDAETKPESWSNDWNYNNSEVVWGATHADFENA